MHESQQTKRYLITLLVQQLSFSWFIKAHHNTKITFSLDESVTLSSNVTPKANAGSLRLNPKPLTAPYVVALHTD